MAHVTDCGNVGSVRVWSATVTMVYHVLVSRRPERYGNAEVELPEPGATPNFLLSDATKTLVQQYDWIV